MSSIDYDGYWFGRKPPDDISVVAAWGCRAILSGRGAHQHLDIPPDRMQLWAADETDITGFVAWLNADLSDWLMQRKCDQDQIDPTGATVFTLDAAPYFATACANASYGYLYVGAWMTAPNK